jgi:riboflavin kinase/FMN adenylyltransferase
VVTFDRHPSAVVAPDRKPPLIQRLSQKLRTIEQLGAECAWVIRFDASFSRKTGETFVREIVDGFAPLHAVFVGERFRFGYRRAGTVELLRRLGAELGYSARAIPRVRIGGEVISSSHLRRLIARGQLELVARLLGRPYALASEVCLGDRLGRRLGFPTANLDVAGLVLPPNGVYAARARIGEGEFPAALNIGIRPTVANCQPEVRAEMHVLDWSGDLYGREIEAVPVRKLRDERRFDSLESLRFQIQADVAAVRRSLGFEAG